MEEKITEYQMPLSVVRFIHTSCSERKNGILRAMETINTYMFHGLYDHTQTPFTTQEWEWIKSELSYSNNE